MKRCETCDKEIKKPRLRQRWCNRQCQPKKIEILNCIVCNMSFKSYRSTSKYCSSTCYDSTRKRDIQECKTCNNKFDPIYSKQKYCSDNCRKTGFSNTRKAQAKLYEYTCAYCDKIFSCKKKDKKYCSSKCYYKSRDKSVTKTCEQCNEEFTVAYRFRDQKFCNQTCMGKSYQVEMNETTCRYCKKS